MVAGLQDRLNRLLAILVHFRGILQPLRISDNHRERVVEVMGHTARHSAKGLKSLGLLNLSREFGFLFCRHSTCGDIMNHALQAIRTLRIVACRRAAFPNPFDGPVRRDDTVFDRVWCAALDLRVDGVPYLLAVIGMDQVIIGELAVVD
ncbi:MAG: hypothetical protein BWX70_02310 [Verrucomicrobia bacterium ADurb.Bin070]|nr:MAG: hypothetical protein BWX70_02310 [Verrucomicrobia bacterium ADurb.Bin070]